MNSLSGPTVPHRYGPNQPDALAIPLLWRALHNRFESLPQSRALKWIAGTRFALPRQSGLFSFRKSKPSPGMDRANIITMQPRTMRPPLTTIAWHRTITTTGGTISRSSIPRQRRNTVSWRTSTASRHTRTLTNSYKGPDQSNWWHTRPVNFPPSSTIFGTILGFLAVTPSIDVAPDRRAAGPVSRPRKPR